MGTPFEAESFINSWLEDMRGNIKWGYDLVEDDAGIYRLVDQPVRNPGHLIRTTSN